MRWWVLGWWVLGQPSSNSIPICFGWFSLNMSPHLILWTTLWGRYDHSHSTDTLRKWCARAIAASRVSGCAPNMSQHGRPETILESIPKRIKESDWKLRPHTSKMQMTSLKSAVVKNLPLKKKKKNLTCHSSVILPRDRSGGSPDLTEKRLGLAETQPMPSASQPCVLINWLSQWQKSPGACGHE